MNDELNKLYTALIGKGYTTDDLGDENTFRSMMSDKNNRKDLYDYVSERGDFRIGDYDAYEQRLTSQPIDKSQYTFTAEQLGLEETPYQFGKSADKRQNMSSVVAPMGDEVSQMQMPDIMRRQEMPSENRHSDIFVGRESERRFADAAQNLRKAQADYGVNATEENAGVLENAAKNFVKVEDMQRAEKAEQQLRDEGKLRRGVKAGWDKEKSRLKRGAQYFVGEAANLLTGSSLEAQDIIERWDELTGLRNDATAVVSNSDANKIRHINELVKELGSLEAAKEEIEWRANNVTWGDRQIQEASRIINNYYETEGVGAWVGGMIPQMIPAATGMLVSAITKSPTAAKWVGRLGLGGMSMSTAGQSMKEARDYGADNWKVWAVGLGNGAIEMVTEAIPYNRYTKRIANAVGAKVGQELSSTIVNNPSAREELEKLLVKANKELGGNLLGSRNVKDYLTDVAAEGASEFTAEALQTITPMLYQNPEDYPTLWEVVKNGWEGAKGGIFMGSILGGVSKGAEYYTNDQRRKAQGYVRVAEVNDGKNVGIGEVVGEREGKNLVMLNGGVIEVAKDKMGEEYTFSYPAFKNAENLNMQDISFEQGYNTEPTGANALNAISGYDKAKQEVVRALGLAEDDDVDVFLGGRTAEDIANGDEVIEDAVNNYLVQKARMEGIQEKFQQTRERQYEESDRSIDSNANKANPEMTYSTAYEGEKVFIVNGNVVLNEDGTIDVNGSSETLYAKFPDGHVEMISPDQFTEVFTASRTEDLKTAGRAEIDAYWERTFNNAEAQAAEQEKREAGVVFSKTDAQGEHRIEILNEGEEMSSILLDGAEMEIPTEELNRWKQEAGLGYSGLKFEHDGRQIEVLDNGSPLTRVLIDGREMRIGSATLDRWVKEAETQSTSADNAADNGTPADDVPDYFRLGGKNYSVASRNADGSVDVIVDSKRETLPAGTDYSSLMPTDKKGDVIFTAMPVERTHEYFVQKVTNDKARALMIEKNRKKAETERKKFDKDPDVGLDPDKWEEDNRKWEEGKKAAQAKVDYWNEVAKREAEITRSETREAVDNIKPDVVEETADEFIANQLAEIKITPESFKRETGLSNTEQSQLVGVISNDGVSVERAAEIIAESYGDELRGLGFGGGMQDVRDIIINILSQGNPRSYARKGREAREVEDVERQMADAEAWAKGAFDMKLEELYLYEETILPRIMRDYEGFDENEYYSNLAENYENDTTRESESIGRGSEVLQDEQPVPASGTPVAGQRDEGGAIHDDVQGGGQNGVAQEEVPVNEPVGETDNSTVSQTSGQVAEGNAPGQSGIDHSLSQEEAQVFITEMEANAEVAPEIELTIENWDSLFGEDGLVETPIGKVKMGENQFTKLMRQGRDGKLGMVKPTLENPDVIIEDESKAKNGETERPSSYVFVKSFKKADGSRYYYFTSVTVSKDGKEVIVSNQEKRRNAIANLLTNGKLVWKHADNVSNASDVANGLYSSQGNSSDLAAEGTDAPQTNVGVNEVYNRHTTAKQPTETVEASQDAEQSGTQATSSMNAPTTSSASEGTTQSANSQENAQKSGEDERGIYLAEIKALQERLKAFAQKSPGPRSFAEAYTANDAELIKRLDKQFNDALQTLVPLDIPAIEDTIKGMKNNKSIIKAGSAKLTEDDKRRIEAFDHIEKAVAKRKKQLEKELTEDDKRRIDIIKRGNRGELKETAQSKQENKAAEERLKNAESRKEKEESTPEIQEPRSVEEDLDNGDKRITSYNSRGEVATVAIERDGKVVSVDSYDEGVLFEHTEYDGNGKATSVTRYDKSGNVVGTQVYEDGKAVPSGKQKTESGKQNGKQKAKTPMQRLADRVLDRTEEKQNAKKGADRIDDVGEKIGGARKDRFAEGMARIKAELEETDETLADKLAKLPVSQVFNFDLEKLREGGIPNEAISFIKIVKDYLPAKPRKTYKIRSWVNNTLALYKLCLEAGTNWDRVNTLLNGPQFTSSSLKELFDAYMAVGGFDSGMNIGNAKLRQLDNKSGRYDENGKFVTLEGKWYVRDAGKHGGIYDTKEEAVNALKAFAGDKAGVTSSGKKKEVKFAVYQRRQDKSIFIAVKGKSDIVIQDGFASSKEAFDYIEANNAELQERYRALLDKTNADFEDNRPREGRDYRDGKDIPAEEFRTTFGFRGVEFGNWMTQEDRRKALNECYDALMDLAAVCKVSPQALSLGGTLGMAFGARGGGRFSAHYEPGKLVINLTKTKGAGSLAHEWFHALDNYFAKMGSEGLDVYATAGEGLFPEGISSIGKRYYDRKSGQMLTEEEYNERMNRHEVRQEMADAWKSLMETLKKSDYYKRSAAYAGLHNSKYWSRPTELGARAFSTWVENELSKQGASNDYLANNPRFLVSEATDEQSRFMPYPFDADATWMEEAFGNLFEVMQEKTVDGQTVLYRTSEDAEDIPRLDKHRVGSGPLTDREVVMESDVYSKVLGKPRYYGQKQRNYVARQRAKMAQKATELAEKLNTPIEVRETAEGLTGKKAKAKGWYDVKSGNIVVVVSNHGSIEDIQATVLHEVVAHKGLRQMFGEHFDTFLDNVYNNVDAEIRAEIDALTEKYGNTREATEEYLASLAENTYFEKVNPSLWSRIKQWFLNMLTEAGIKLDFELSDNELRYILWRSHQRLVNPGIYNPVTRITDVAVRARLGIGEYAPAVEEMSHVAEEDAAEYANKNQDIFVSNAQRAVEGIQQNKATAEQWIAMLKKNGGLKAGEDAWLGLEEWLNEKQGAVTKQEILDYIAQNRIQIEEVEYGESVEGISEETVSESEEFGNLASSLIEYDEEGYPYVNRERFEQLRNEDEDFLDGFSIDYWGEGIEVNDPEAAARYLGLAEGSRLINSTRLNYTTDGLENKREIALVVPTVESWNASDEIHFGDAGNGRAVAWVRFGETTDSEGNRVLVIDEIQSKRHQEGREKGYKDAKLAELDRKLNNNTRSTVEELEEAGRLSKERYDYIISKIGGEVAALDNELTELQQKAKELGTGIRNEEAEKQQIANLEVELEGVRNVRDYDRITAEIEEIKERMAQRRTEFDSVSLRMREVNTQIDELINNYVRSQRGAVDAAPFDKNWHELVMKRMLRLAAEEGFDKVAWTTGEQQAERYSLGTYINSIERFDVDDRGKRFELNGSARIGMTVGDDGVVIASSQGEYEGKPLSDVVGKELAEKMLVMENRAKLEDLDLKVGGEGMKGFYDRMLPSFVQKYTKKWGAKVGEVTMPSLEENNTMWSVDVTPEMQESVMQGQTMFRITDADRQALEFKRQHRGSANIVAIDTDALTAELVVYGFTADEIQDIREKYEKGALGFYDRDRNTIYLLGKDHSRRRNNATFWHENTHKAIQDLDIPQEVMDEFYAIPSKRFIDFFEKKAKEFYGPEEYAEELIAYFVEDVQSSGSYDNVTKALGTSAEGMERLKEIVEPIINYINHGRRVNEGTEGNHRTVVRGAFRDINAEAGQERARTEAEGAGTEDTRFRVTEEEAERIDGSIDDIQTQPLTLMERITNSLLEVSAKNKENLGLRADALRNFGRDINRVLSAMKAQREYDKSTVDTLVKLAKMYFKNAQLLGEVTPYEVARIMGVLNRSVGKRDISTEAARLMDILLDAHTNALAGILDKAEKVKAKKVNAAGVEVMGRLDKYGQKRVDEYRAAKEMTPEKLEEAIYDSDNRLAELEQRVREELGLPEGDVDQAARDYTGDNDVVNVYMDERARLEGLTLAREYKESIQHAQEEIKDLKKELRQAEEDYRLGNIDGKSLKEFRKSVAEAIMESKAELIEGYHSLIYKFQENTKESSKRAKAFAQAQIDRAREIQHNANSDMEGISAATQGTHPENYNNAVMNALRSPFPTFQGMLKKFGEKNVEGKGYLYERFIPQATKASDNEFRGKVAARVMIEGKLKEIYGKNMTIAKFMKQLREYGATVTYREGNEMKQFDLTKGQMLYIYMVNKMSDGQMKLRRMGITDDVVTELMTKLPEEAVQFADWAQNELLKDLRGKYNAVHERVFGAPMAAIENYFPIKIRKEARGEKGDVSEVGQEGKPSTVTGSIIKRTKNATAIDLSADAMQVLMEHIDDMEHWAAFAEFNRDLNVLLNYKHFQNQVKNMTSVRYGSGTELWKNFRKTAQIVSGTYRPSDSSIDRAVQNIAKGLTRSKINFRLFTAIKQLLSAPAFWTDAGVEELAYCYANPKGSFDWALENLPGFAERWQGRTMGNEKLLKSDSDWEVWRNEFVEKATRWGMTPNAAIDALTVAQGARAVYMTKLEQFKKAGYTEQRANEKALQAAAEAYNESQQSSEGVYLSPLQVEGTVASAIFSTFKNSSFGYTRKTAQAIANIKRKMRKGYKEETIAFMTKQMIRDGLSEENAKKMAEKVYNKSKYKDVANVAMFGFGLNLLWEAGGYAIYLLLGDDDEEKEKMTKEIALRGSLGLLNGVPFGETMISAAMAVKEGDTKYFRLPELVAVSDIKNLAQVLNYDPVRGANDIVNMLASMGVGVTPQVLTDILVAFGDVEEFSAEELGMFVARFVNAPQSNLDRLMVDDAMENSAVNAEEIMRRYAEYKKSKNAPITQFFYPDEIEQKAIERYAKRFKKLLDERLESVVEDNDAYSLFYEDADARMKSTLAKMRQGYLAEDKAFEKLDNKELVDRVVHGKQDINEHYFGMTNAEDEDTAFVIRSVRKKLEDLKESGKLSDKEQGLLSSLNRLNNAISRAKKLMEQEPERAQGHMAAIREMRAQAIKLINEYSNE